MKTVVFSTIAIIASIMNLIWYLTDIMSFAGNTLAEKETNKSMLTSLCIIVALSSLIIAARSKRSKKQNIEN